MEKVKSIVESIRDSTIVGPGDIDFGRFVTIPPTLSKALMQQESESVDLHRSGTLER